jgi:hypothetical protein
LIENEIDVTGTVTKEADARQACFMPANPASLDLLVRDGGYVPITIRHPGHTLFQLRIEALDGWVPPGQVNSYCPSHRTILLGPFSFEKCGEGGGKPDEAGNCKGNYTLAFQWDGFDTIIDPDYRIKPPGRESIIAELYDLSHQWSTLIVTSRDQRESSWLEDNMADDLVFYTRDQEKPFDKLDLIKDIMNDDNDYNGYELKILNYEEFSDDLASIHGRYTKLISNKKLGLLQETMRLI